MFEIFNGRPGASGPNFQEVNSLAIVEKLCQCGTLEKLYLLPPEFGGTDDPRNIVYVPRGFAHIKSRIDNNIVRPLIESMQVSKYAAIPEYQGDSFVPIRIGITASHPQNFSTQINIWGPALQQNNWESQHS